LRDQYQPDDGTSAGADCAESLRRLSFSFLVAANARPYTGSAPYDKDQSGENFIDSSFA
jgi:hypothetical protein